MNLINSCYIMDENTSFREFVSARDIVVVDVNYLKIANQASQEQMIA